MAESMLKIGIVTDCKLIDPHYFHAAGDKYVRGITEGMGAVPIIIPALGDREQLQAYLSIVDGILLTGAPSNIEPHHYQGEPSDTPIHDPQRDATTLPLITMAIEANIPLFGICRGFQEINVALGGSLHQKVQEIPAMMDHREDKSQPLEVQYAPVHRIDLIPGGLLDSLVGRSEVMVNSIHQQGVKTLGQNLVAEATAPDGLIEAFRLNQDERFALAVQWHPEWKVTENPFYQSIFTAFKEACQSRKSMS